MTDKNLDMIPRVVGGFIGILLWPLALIWAWNHLGFPYIDYTFFNWLAVFVLTGAFRISRIDFGTHKNNR